MKTILRAVAGVAALVFTVFGISKFLENRKEKINNSETIL